MQTLYEKWVRFLILLLVVGRIILLNHSFVFVKFVKVSGKRRTLQRYSFNIINFNFLLANFTYPSLWQLKYAVSHIWTLVFKVLFSTNMKKVSFYIFPRLKSSFKISFIIILYIFRNIDLKVPRKSFWVLFIGFQNLHLCIFA